VRSITIAKAYGADPDCAAVARWLPQLDELHFLNATVSTTGVASLADGLAGRVLGRLTVTGTGMAPSLRRFLQPLCKELVFVTDVAPTSADDVRRVVHATKPEWGHGKVVREADGKLHVEFENAGLKVFKADAPFLKPA
jgi:hypothetical protein